MEYLHHLGKYELGKELGEGATSVVREAVHTESGKKYAMKIFKALSKKSCFDNEVEALLAVDHPNVVRVHEVFEDAERGRLEDRVDPCPPSHRPGRFSREMSTPSRSSEKVGKSLRKSSFDDDKDDPPTLSETATTENESESSGDSVPSLLSCQEGEFQATSTTSVEAKEELFAVPPRTPPQPKRTYTTCGTRAIVLPLSSNGDVLSYLLDGGAFEERVARTLFKRCLEAVQACHNAGILHRDVKPDNLLFTENFDVLLSDFGFSRRRPDDEENVKLYGDLGSRGYIAPEVGDGKGYDHRCDLWSLGVTLFVMMTGRPPYASESPRDYWFNLLLNRRYSRFWRVVELLHKHSFPDMFKDLINKMLCPEPAERITIEKALEHPWMREQLLSQNDLASIMRNHSNN